MFRTNKTLFLIVLAQAACLALGFWLQAMYLRSSAQQTAEQELWEHLARLEARSLQPLRRMRLMQPSHGEQLADSPQRLIAAIADSQNVGIVIVDKSGRVVCSAQPGQANVWPIGQPISWRPVSQQTSAVSSAFGKLDVATDQRAAMSLPIEGSEELAMVYALRPTLSTGADRVLSALPLASGIALLWTIGLQFIAAYLISSRAEAERSASLSQKEKETLRQLQDLLRTRDAVLFGLAKLAESRDPETGHHLERISHYSTRLATELHRHPKYRHEVTSSFVRLIGINAALHDIGKVGIDDAVLLKPGKLSPDERIHMQQHTLAAGECLMEIERRLGTSNFLQMAREIALYHHERWDGAGYPKGLSGEQIPLAARIVAIADVYDALSSKRVYKSAFSHEKCAQMIREGAGSQFDPVLVSVFLEIEGDFERIARKYSDLTQDNDGESPAQERSRKQSQELRDDEESPRQFGVRGDSTNSAPTANEAAVEEIQSLVNNAL